MRFAYTVAAPDGGAPALALSGDFADNLRRVRDAGFQGAELYVKDPARVDLREVADRIQDAGLLMPAVCTGEVYGTDGLFLSANDPRIRQAALDRTRRIIEFAAHWKAPVNIGRLRGPVPPGGSVGPMAERVLEAFREVAAFAAGCGVEVILEPINRHEINFINTTAEGIAWVQAVGHPAFRLMLDLYHVSLEDPSITGAFIAAREILAHVHICDSNRRAPGWGHLNLKEVLATLKYLDYAGWISVEAVQGTNPSATVVQSGRHLRELLVTLESAPGGAPGAPSP